METLELCAQINITEVKIKKIKYEETSFGLYSAVAQPQI